METLSLSAGSQRRSLKVLYSHHKILKLCLYNNKIFFMAHNKGGLLVIRLWEEVYYELNHNYKLSFNITMEETWHSKRFPWNHLLVVNIKTSRWNHLLVLIFTKPPAPRSSDFHHHHRFSALICPHCFRPRDYSSPSVWAEPGGAKLMGALLSKAPPHLFTLINLMWRSGEGTVWKSSRARDPVPWRWTEMGIGKTWGGWATPGRGRKGWER